MPVARKFADTQGDRMDSLGVAFRKPRRNAVTSLGRLTTLRATSTVKPLEMEDCAASRRDLRERPSYPAQLPMK